MAMVLVATCISAQDPPSVIWDGFFPAPDDYEYGNYTANDIKQSPYGGYVIVGSRKVSAANGYSEVLVMRVDQEGRTVEMGWGHEHGGVNFDSIPWDQEAYDMIITPLYPHVSYLLTGYRDTTLTSANTPPGLMLMEVWGSGEVLFDSLYYNNNLHHIAGRSIQPAIGGGFIIACSFREDGGGTDQTMVTRLVKNEKGKYEHTDMPFYKIIPVGQSGYARWIHQFGDGYLLGGTAINGDNKFDLFIQKLSADRVLEWTKYYGMEDMDEFADALVYGDTVYIAGSASVPGTSYYRDEIYVIKANASGEVIWEKTYGGANRHYSNKIMMTGEGDLLIAGTAYDASMHTHMLLMKIDAETGDSLWTQSYEESFTYAGIRDAIRTDDYGYLVAGRGSYGQTQDPHVYLMKLDPGDEKEHLQIPRTDLSIPISPSAIATDAISFTADVDEIYGVTVVIDSLFHPSVGDLEVTLSHSGTTVTLADRPVHSGENFISTGFSDLQYKLLDWDFASYSSWYKPEDPLSVFNSHKPAGDWILSVTDHGTGVVKATDRVLEGWSLNLLTESSGGVGIPTLETLANFGLEPIRPNPVNQEALISFQIPKPAAVNLKVYNQLGQEVASLAHEDLPEGVHSRIWNPGSLAPGTYFIHLEAGGMISVRKAIIVK